MTDETVFEFLLHADPCDRWTAANAGANKVC